MSHVADRLQGRLRQQQTEQCPASQVETQETGTSGSPCEFLMKMRLSSTRATCSTQLENSDLCST